MITFQIEPSWRAFAGDAESLFERHWRDIAVDQDRIALDIDHSRYEQMDAAGILLIVSMRDDGRLVGYYVAFLLPHVHYRSSGLMAFTDFYYVAPEARRGTRGARLLAAAEQALREKGVVKAYLSCKVHHDNSALFERLGWKLTDKNFTKTF